jgi:ATP-dependent DNA helicase
MLPKKREYILYAPMTKEQMELYNILSDKNADARKYLENKVVERLVQSSHTTASSRSSSPRGRTVKGIKVEESDTETDIPLFATRGRKRKADAIVKEEDSAKPVNAFERLMNKRQASAGTPTRTGSKRKPQESLPTPNKSAKSSRQSTPAGSVRSRRSRKRKSYTEADASEEDKLSDDEFESRLAEQLAIAELDSEDSDDDPQEQERAKTLELASRYFHTG